LAATSKSKPDLPADRIIRTDGPCTTSTCPRPCAASPTSGSKDAMKEGKFDNLPGAGQPAQPRPDSRPRKTPRMTWWALRILKNNNFTPDEIRYRKAIDHLKARLNNVQYEWEVAPIVDEGERAGAQAEHAGHQRAETGYCARWTRRRSSRGFRSHNPDC